MLAPSVLETHAFGIMNFENDIWALHLQSSVHAKKKKKLDRCVTPETTQQEGHMAYPLTVVIIVQKRVVW